MNAVRKILIAVFILIFIGGVAYALYPFIFGRYLERQYAAEAENFLTHTLPATVTHRADPDDPASGMIAVPIEHQDLLDAMREYNERIYSDRQTGLCDAWAYQTPSFDLAAYGIEDGIIGVINIPALDVELPIYLGANSANMAKGAVHLSQTSLPIGGENTNAVIAAHRGWYDAAYFRYIEKLNVGNAYELDAETFSIDGETITIHNPTLAQALRSISPKLREIIFLLYFLDKSESQIGRMLNMGKSGVSRRHITTLSRLREIMEELEHE